MLTPRSCHLAHETNELLEFISIGKKTSENVPIQVLYVLNLTVVQCGHPVVHSKSVARSVFLLVARSFWLFMRPDPSTLCPPAIGHLFKEEEERKQRESKSADEK